MSNELLKDDKVKCRIEEFNENAITHYINQYINKLEKSGDMVWLKNVNPHLIESVIGMLEEYDVTGRECDYWGETDEYEVFGTMTSGVAKITKK